MNELATAKPSNFVLHLGTAALQMLQKMLHWNWK